jgi:hypothetical protein
MKANCVRCGAQAFATLKVEATVGETRLAVSGEVDEAGICAACMIGLAEFFNIREQTVGLRQQAEAGSLLAKQPE